MTPAASRRWARLGFYAGFGTSVVLLVAWMVAARAANWADFEDDPLTGLRRFTCAFAFPLSWAVSRLWPGIGWRWVALLGPGLNLALLGAVAGWLQEYTGRHVLLGAIADRLRDRAHRRRPQASYRVILAATTAWALAPALLGHYLKEDVDLSRLGLYGWSVTHAPDFLVAAGVVALALLLAWPAAPRALLAARIATGFGCLGIALIVPLAALYSYYFAAIVFYVHSHFWLPIIPLLPPLVLGALQLEVLRMLRKPFAPDGPRPPGTPA